MKNDKLLNIAAAALVLLAVGLRFLPHLPNFTPVLGLALFAGHIFQSKKLSYLLPLLALFISDIAIGLYAGIGFNYFAYAAIIFLGVKMKSRSSANLFVNSVLSSVVFFIFSNLGVWYSTAMYEKSWQGLQNCFVMALPFFNNTLLSTMLTTVALFFVYSLAQISITKSALRGAK